MEVNVQFHALATLSPRMDLAVPYPLDQRVGGPHKWSLHSGQDKIAAPGIELWMSTLKLVTILIQL
jgi:hypothetical protein